jgi:hypothetical protein
VRVREPVARPLDVIALELLLTATQAFLAGVLLYLAAGFWEDSGVALGSFAAVLVLLAGVVGGTWLYWLLGGVGWPLAAVDAAAGTYLGALLLLTWLGQEVQLSGVPLLLAAASAVYGVIGGVFLDSPRRWRWDQRERPRSGTRVPRISDTTQTVIARVPRSLPRRATAEEPVNELVARIGAAASSASALRTDGPPPGGTEPGPDLAADDGPAVEPAEGEPAGTELTDAPDVAGVAIEVPDAPEPVLPTDRRQARTSAGAEQKTGSDAIELPTMVEPRAQRSPWAWAAPPEWTHDEDDEPPRRGPSTKA